MANLTAQGEQPADHWRREIPDEGTTVLGRDGEGWPVPWEQWMSHRHAELAWHDGRLHVRRIDGARNPIHFRGQESDEFELRPGESFVIGGTLFTLDAGTETPSSSDARPVLQERAVGPHELEGIPFRDAPHRLDVLSRLPHVISSAADDQELLIQFVNLLMAGVPRADVIAIVELEADKINVRHVDTRRFEGTGFQPSRRLAREAVGRQQRTVLHVWASDQPPDTEQSFTMQGGLDWAFCVPVRGEPSQQWGIYAAGRFRSDDASTVMAPWGEHELGDDLKFAELASSILGSLWQVRKLQRDRGRLSQFFSPVVQKVLTTSDPDEALRPRETEVTVMFCDLRGFSRKVEAESGQLLGVLERVSQALGVMTQQILDHRGVVADFLGDAALGFWGWPIPEPEMIEQACLAALGIRRYYETLPKQSGHPLAGFRVGIGLATGQAVAGRIGPKEQAKVTVFGPVVNLASRLEGMTKLLHVPILTDEATARVVREEMSPGVARCRRLALVRPYGLDTPLLVHELLPPISGKPSSGAHHVLSDEDVARYENALDAFLAGKWEEAYEHLHRVPAWDLGKDILTGFIIQHNHAPPAGWDGVIPLTSKS